MKERLFTIVLLLCAFVLNASSQKAATVKSFVQTTDHISGSDRRNDMNGTPCALVKVQVVDDISRIEGNRIGDIVTKGVEKWVYMCKGSRNMRIHLKNYLPVKVMFQDYQINGLESNRVYELVIETPDVPAQLDKQQKLVINYTPANAMVLIDSKPYRGNGRIETELPVGEHRYIIAADGYITAEGVIKLNEQSAREITERLTAETPTPSENKPDKTITKQPINKASDNFVDQQRVEKGKRALNYRFDYTKMKINSVAPQNYIIRNGGKNKHNRFDSYQEFKEELERIFIRAANEELRDYNGYKLMNSGIFEYEVIITLQEMDEDGEHNVRGVVHDKENGQEISSFTIHVGSGNNNFFKGFDKQIQKSGKRFAEGLINNVLKKRTLESTVR